MTNALLDESHLPFQLPDFSQIAEEDYLPAIKAAMAEHEAEVEEILANDAEPTIENTLVALEAAGQKLSRVTAAFFNQASADATQVIRDTEEEVVPLLTTHSDAIDLDPRLWERINNLYLQRHDLELDDETDWLLQETWRDLKRSGADLDDDSRQKLATLNSELASLTTTFGQRLLEDTNASAVIVKDVSELSGVDEATIASFAAAAERRNLPEGQYVIELGLPTIQPILASLANRDLRRRVHEASTSRAANGGSTDTRELVAKIAALPAERAELLGHPNHASVIADEGTARTTTAISELLDQLAPIAVRNAKKDAHDLQAELEKDHPGETLQAWDWPFYEEKLRAIRYSIDDAATKPFFELWRTLNDGVFFAATALYGLTFQPRTDLVGYHDDVSIFQVNEEDGSELGLFVFDPYTRDTKYGGAWMNDLVGQNTLLEQHAVIVNNLNIVKPTGDQPTLLTIDEVTTLFHEFGHALHGLLSNVKYPSFTGTSVPRDIVEFPSQVNEMWMLHPDVLPRYAKHHETDEALPEETAQRLRDAQIFGQAFSTTEFLAAALLDQAWHRLTSEEAQQITTAEEVTVFEAQALKSAGIDIEQIQPRYRTSYFAHTFNGGYDAGYYSYIWAEVFDADAVTWFEENGGLSREAGQKFRDGLLGRGGSADTLELYHAFRGRDPELAHLIQRRGLTS